MPLHAGREFLSIPGPTVIPDVVLAAMQRPAVDIYSGPLLALTDSLLADLSKIFRTAGRSYIYIANGHGAWEAALTNVLSRGDKVLVLESGRFAIGWGEAARMLGARGRDPARRLPPRREAGGRRGAAEGRIARARSRRCWSRRSIPRPASSTTSKRSGRRCAPPATMRC